MSQTSSEHGIERDAPGLTGRERTVELIIAWLLRIGVWTSIVLIVAGLIMLAISDGGALLHARGSLNDVLKQGLAGQPVKIDQYPDVFRALGRGQAYGLIDLGLLVLVLTPVLRVAVSVVAFLIEKDRLYAAITTLVLALLLTSILLGKAGG